MVNLEIDELLNMTEIFQILATAKLVSQIAGKEFHLPKELIEINDLIQKLAAETEVVA
jgi:hypothetical protein